MYSGFFGRLLAQLRHHALNQFLRIGQTLHNYLDVHDRLAGPALALAIDAMLTHEGHGVGDSVHGHSQPTPGHAHHRLVMFQFFLFFVEYRHALIVSSGQGGA